MNVSRRIFGCGVVGFALTGIYSENHQMKFKYFAVTNATEFENCVNAWLSAHPNISVVAANSFANVSGWGYALLYTEC